MLHTFIENKNTAELNLINIPNFKIPEDVYSRQSIIQSIRNLDESQAHDIINNCAIPIKGDSIDRKIEICEGCKYTDVFHVKTVGAFSAKHTRGFTVQN